MIALIDAVTDPNDAIAADHALRRGFRIGHEADDLLVAVMAIGVRA